MNFIQASSNYVREIFPTFQTNTTAKNFQQAISSGNISVITQLGTENLLSKPYLMVSFH